MRFFNWLSQLGTKRNKKVAKELAKKRHATMRRERTMEQDIVAHHARMAILSDDMEGAYKSVNVVEPNGSYNCTFTHTNSSGGCGSGSFSSSSSSSSDCSGGGWD